MGPFSSDSKSSQRTTNQQQTVSDQGIAISNRHSGNTRTNTKLGKGATLTINQGLGADEFNAGLAALAQGLAANVANNPATQSDDSGFQEALAMALENRVNAGTEKAVDEIKSGSPSTVRNWTAYAVAAVVVFALLLVFSRKK